MSGFAGCRDAAGVAQALSGHVVALAETVASAGANVAVAQTLQSVLPPYEVPETSEAAAVSN